MTHTDTICFVDVETSGLRHDSRPWEIACIVERPNKPDELHVWHVADFAPAQADPAALRLADFYGRHPNWAPDPFEACARVTGPNPDQPVHHSVMPEGQIVGKLERLIRDATIVGCNPAYDVDVLTRMFDRYGYAWTAHYRPVCATTYAAALVDRRRAERGEEPAPLPWNNSAIGAELGVPRAGFGPPHSALADAFYARALLHASRGVWENA